MIIRLLFFVGLVAASACAQLPGEVFGGGGGSGKGVGRYQEVGATSLYVSNLNSGPLYVNETGMVVSASQVTLSYTDGTNVEVDLRRGCAFILNATNDYCLKFTHVVPNAFWVWIKQDAQGASNVAHTKFIYDPVNVLTNNKITFPTNAQSQCLLQGWTMGTNVLLTMLTNWQPQAYTLADTTTNNASPPPAGAWKDIEASTADTTIGGRADVLRWADVSVVNGSATKMRIMVTNFAAQAGIKVALYTNTTRIATGSATITANGYKEISFGTPVTVYTGGTYSLAFVAENDQVAFPYNSTKGSINYSIDNAHYANGPEQPRPPDGYAQGNLVMGLWIE